MIINGINISAIGCALLKYRTTPSQYSGRSYWDNGSNNPVILSGKYTFSNLEVDIYIEGENAAEVERKKSQLNAMMENPIIILDEVDPMVEYVCAYENQVVIEKINEVASIATYNIKTLKRGIEKTIPLINLKNTVTIDGTTMADAIYEVTAPNDLVDFAINDIKIKTLKGNRTMIIDGMSKTVTVDGENKFCDTEFWSFPKFNPGNNVIDLSAEGVDVKLKYHPRYS